MRADAGRIAIVGGGISGVAAAYELATKHPEQSFVLFEASARLGGTVETVQADGFTVECGPDAWVSEKPWARELAMELGMEAELLPSKDAQRRTYIASGRELLPMPDGMRMMVPTRWEPLLHSPLLSWQGKLAYLREPKRADELKQSALLGRGAEADEPVAAFVIRHFGEEVNRTLAAPLLSGVFGGDVNRLSVRAVMAPLVKMEAEHGSLIDALRKRAETAGSRGEAVFTSLRTGLEMLIHKMAARLPAGSVLLGEGVQSVKREQGGWRVQTGRRSECFEAVLLATPAHVTRGLLEGMGETAARSIAALLPEQASSAIVVALGFRRERAAAMRVPRGFGFLVPEAAAGAGDEAQLLACTFVDQKFDKRVPEGAVLLRGFFGGAAAEQLSGCGDEEIVAAARKQLGRLLGALPAEADLTMVRRWPLSLPQYFVGHVERIAEAKRRLGALPGLWLVGNAYDGVGLPDLIREARTVVGAMARFSHQSGSAGEQRLSAATS